MTTFEYNIDGVSLSLEFEGVNREAMKEEKYLGWMLAHDAASKCTAKGSKANPNAYVRGSEYSDAKAKHFAETIAGMEAMKALLPGLKISAGRYIKPEDKVSEAVKAERKAMHESMKGAAPEELLRRMFPEFYAPSEPASQGEVPASNGEAEKPSEPTPEAEGFSGESND